MAQSNTVLLRPASYMLRAWEQWTYKSGVPQKGWRRYGNIRLGPNTWAHVASKDAQNQHGNDDNRMEVILQREPYDQASGCSPSGDDLISTDTSLDLGGGKAGPQSPTKV